MSDIGREKRVKRRRLWQILIGLPLLAFLFFTASTGCLSYLIRAGAGQVSILCNRRPLNEVINDPGTTAETRQKLIHIQRIRDYARDTLGLTPGGAYTSYVDIKRSAVGWNVSASDKLALKPYTWWFPIVGSVPYLGYFSKEEAEEKERELIEEGLDTSVRAISAYSTLGWFDDPIMSSQLQFPEWYLTGLVIHETAHATIWFPGDVGFNESFASFAGITGALQYYREKEGADSESYQRKIRYLEEREKLGAIFHEYALKLDSMYKLKTLDKEKSREKERIIREFQAELLRRSVNFSTIDIKKVAARDYNNAHFLSHLRYDSGREFFKREFENSKGSWPAFLKRMLKLSEKSPEERRRLLRNK